MAAENLHDPVKVARDNGESIFITMLLQKSAQAQIHGFVHADMDALGSNRGDVYKRQPTKNFWPKMACTRGSVRHSSRGRNDRGKSGRHFFQTATFFFPPVGVIMRKTGLFTTEKRGYS